MSPRASTEKICSAQRAPSAVPRKSSEKEREHFQKVVILIPRIILSEVDLVDGKTAGSRCKSTQSTLKSAGVSRPDEGRARVPRSTLADLNQGVVRAYRHVS